MTKQEEMFFAQRIESHFDAQKGEIYDAEFPARSYAESHQTSYH